MGDLSSPSPAQLALALAIVKTKPPGSGMTEYVLQIRQNIKSSRDADISLSPEMFFDSVTFWKQAYEKSEAENSKLLDRTYELEQRRDALLAKLNSHEDSQSEVKQESKRKATGSQTPRIRTKTQLPVYNSSAPDLQYLRNNGTSTLDELGASTGPFLRQYFTLQKVLQKRPTTTNIVQAAVVLCSTTQAAIQASVPREITKSKSRKLPLAQTQILHVSQTLRSVEVAFALLLQALSKLSASSNSARETGLLIHHVVCLYEVILGILAQYCAITSTHMSSKSDARSSNSSTRRRITKAKLATLIPDPETMSSSPDPVATQLTALLSLIITSLNLTIPSHQNLLEGLLYILLSRAGKFLCIFTFQELKLRPDLQIDPSKLSLPAGLEDAQIGERSLLSTEMEAQYLIPLLRNALAYFNGSEALDPTLSSEEQTIKQGFLASIKDKLQTTLVQAVYGADPNIGRALQPTVYPEGAEVEMLLAEQRGSGLSVPDWYVRQIWELVGWDVLMKGDSL
ncbi:hypothetical protein BJX70DRAFT_207305 [Aspergillus crustosus]